MSVFVVASWASGTYLLAGLVIYLAWKGRARPLRSAQTGSDPVPLRTRQDP